MFNILHVYLDYLAYCKISHWNSGGPPLSYLPVCGTDHRMAVVGFPPKLGTGTFMTLGTTFPLLVQSFDRVIILQCCNVFLENWLIIGNLHSHIRLWLWRFTPEAFIWNRRRANSPPLPSLLHSSVSSRQYPRLLIQVCTYYQTYQAWESLTWILD